MKRMQKHLNFFIEFQEVHKYIKGQPDLQRAYELIPS